jgi:hypothetical protein
MNPSKNSNRSCRIEPRTSSMYACVDHNVWCDVDRVIEGRCPVALAYRAGIEAAAKVVEELLERRPVPAFKAALENIAAAVRSLIGGAK